MSGSCSIGSGRDADDPSRRVGNPAGAAAGAPAVGAPTPVAPPERLIDTSGPGPAVAPVVVVEPRTVSASRDALASLAAGGDGNGNEVRVVGFADLTSPHLVDLLDDLITGPGGHLLWALGVPWPSSGERWLEDLSVQRGLACVRQRGLALVLLGSGPPEVVPALTALEPALVVVHDLSWGHDRSSLRASH